MKKIFALVLIGGLVLVLVSGCSTSPSSSANLNATIAASSVAQLAGVACNLDDSLSSVGALGQAAKASSSPDITAEADGWWYTSYSSSYGSYSESLLLHFKVWDSNSNLLDTEQKLYELGATRSLDKLYVYGALDFFQSGSQLFSISMGDSKSSPLKMENLDSPGSATLDGSTSYAGTSDGKAYSINLTYSSVSLSASGYPSGTINFSITYDGQSYTGSLVCSGTATATVTFSSGLSGSYSVNLDTGVVS